MEKTTFLAGKGSVPAFLKDAPKVDKQTMTLQNVINSKDKNGKPYNLLVFSGSKNTDDDILVMGRQFAKGKLPERIEKQIERNGENVSTPNELEFGIENGMIF